MFGWLKGVYEAAKGGVQLIFRGTASGAARAAGKSPSQIANAAKTAGARAGAVFDVASATAGTAIVGWLGYLGISWTGEKANDASKQIGFLTIMAGLTAIGVAAIVFLRKK